MSSRGPGPMIYGGYGGDRSVDPFGLNGGSVFNKYGDLSGATKADGMQGAGARLQNAHARNTQGIDDWASRFRDDYRKQSQRGLSDLQGNMQAAAQARGFNPAAAMGANYAGGQAAAEVGVHNEAMKRQMAMAEAQGRYGNQQTFHGAQSQMFGMQADAMSEAMRRREAAYQAIMADAENKKNAELKMAGALAGTVGAAAAGAMTGGVGAAAAGGLGSVGGYL